MTNADAEYQISCRNVWKIFGPHPEAIKRQINAGMSKDDILAETGHVVAVKNVSFNVRKGETFVVMGLSGSGKSTLVRCMSRLIKATSGQVLLDGQNILTMDEQALRMLRRKKMSMVFQHFGLFPHRRIIDNVAYGLEVQAIKKDKRHAKAREVLKLVGLAGWENHYPGELSGGMQQRVGIARALAVEPELLMFDEPFSALDPLIRREMQDELINLQQKLQKTIIFITHDFLEAVKLGDHIAIMKDGVVVQIGTPAQLIMQPVNNYVREFTKDVPRTRVLDAQAIMQPPLVVTVSEPPDGIAQKIEQKRALACCVEDDQGRFLGMLRSEKLPKLRQVNGGSLESLLDNKQPTVDSDTLLSDLIPLTVGSDIPLAVINSDRKLLGTVDQTAVMLALSGQTQARGAAR